MCSCMDRYRFSYSSNSLVTTLIVVKERGTAGIACIAACTEEITHSETALATAGAILVAQGTDDFIVGLRHREGRGLRGARRHGDDG